MTATDIALDFVSRINDHSPETLADLMTPDHTFVDSTGKKFEGRDQMQHGWASYFSMFPDYQMRVESSMESGEVVALFGWARATCTVSGETSEENRWEIPFAIRAVVTSQKLREWRVYADNHPVSEILARCRR